MPVKLNEPDNLLPVPGVRLSSGNANIYKNDRDDLVLIEILETGTSAVVQTKNTFAAAPVIVTRNHLSKSTPRYCLINAGNANAGTGAKGIDDALECCRKVSDVAGCDSTQVLPFSTGVIGEYLPVENIFNEVNKLFGSLNEDKWLSCAKAIMTTDTVAKGVSRKLGISGKEITVTGIAKGSGMIRPDMATMLAYIATDAVISKDLLDGLLEQAVEKSFNRICVDGDTSTNDACMLMASGASAIEISDSSAELEQFRVVLDEVCIELAQAIIRDGEGATKFITVDVQNGVSTQQSRDIAYDIATSPLVKTAMFASDPNWGRIIAAIGRSRDKELSADTISFYLNDLCVLKNGGLDESYSEEAGQRVMNAEEIKLVIDLGAGSYNYKVWTCDLSHDYVTINAEYRS